MLKLIRRVGSLAQSELEPISIAAAVALTLVACGQHTTAEPKAKRDTSDSSSTKADATKAASSKDDAAKDDAAGMSEGDQNSAGANAAGSPAGASGAGNDVNHGAAGASAGKAGSAGASGAASPEPMIESFRISGLELRDPHLFVGDTDLTDRSPLGVSVNLDLIPSGLTKDYDNDGFIDVSVVAQLDANKHLHLVDARCPPSDPDHCMQHPSPGLDVEWPIETVQSGECLTLPSSSDYDPPAAVPETPCLLTQGGRDVSMTLGGVPIAMTETRMAMRREGQNLEGLIIGFVTLEKAQTALLPSYVPVLAGSPLSRYLRDSDRDHAESPSGDNGYWFYVNFVAEPASYAE